MMYNVAIIDDETGVRRLLQLDLSKHFQQVNVVGEANTFESGKSLILGQKIDIVFMDVDLHDVDGDGIALVELLAGEPVVVIFFTGHDQYVEDSYRLDAAYYVRKPYTLDQLKRAMERAIHRASVFRKPSAFYRLSTLKGYEFLAWEDIVVMDADGETTQIFLRSGEKRTSTEALGEVCRKMPAFTFHRVHRSHVINRAYVRGYQREGYAVIEGGRHIPVSSSNKEEFLRWIERPIE